LKHALPALAKIQKVKHLRAAGRMSRRGASARACLNHSRRERRTRALAGRFLRLR
jgi:hypothetical protein